jgi:hypothetical protein
MKRIWWLLAAMCLLHGAQAREPDDAARLLVDAIGARELVFLGEMHGTRETPLVTSLLVAHYANAEPVLLGLEVTSIDQGRVDAFLDSAGRQEDFVRLLAGAHWREPMHDGRDSVAMLGLLEHVRRLRARGADVAVVLFDVPGGGERDRRMAHAMRAALRSHPGSRTIVLTGNVHAMTGEPPSMVLPDGTPYEAPTTMARHLSDLAPLSVGISAATGEYWGCRARDCGPHPAGFAGALGSGLALERMEPGSSWDLRLQLPRSHASPPAIASGDMPDGTAAGSRPDGDHR